MTLYMRFLRAYTRFVIRWVIPAVEAVAVTVVVLALVFITLCACVLMAHGGPAQGMP